jgi:MFS family permease
VSEYADLLRYNRSYRSLWLGSVVSQLGDWFNLIASAAIVAQLTDTGAAISFLFLARFLPLFLFSPLAGVLADKYDRRHIMIASDVLRAVTVLGFLIVRQPNQIWLLYLLTTVQFALSAVFTPARTAVLANVVRPDELVPANALDSLSWSTMLAFGALAGGIVAATLGIAQAFILDALTFLLSAVFIAAIPGPIKADPGTRKGGWFNFLDGLRYLRGETAILGISLVKGAGALVWGAINVLEITYAEDIFTLESPLLDRLGLNLDSATATLGLMYAVSGLGTGFGPLFLRRLLGDVPVKLRGAISGGFVLMSIGILILSLAPTLGIFSIGTFVRTVGSGTVWVFSAALLQLLVPDRFRGRVFAFEFALLTLTQSLSIIWAGYAQDSLGLSVDQVAMSMALLALVMAGLWTGFNIRILSRSPAGSES